MIFVTVGTHEQQFNRLLEAADQLKIKGIITEDMVFQTGYSDYIPQMCECRQFYPSEQMKHLMEEARIVITHGGPSSFITPLQMGKIPIVVPREKEFGEHINDHQVDFCRMVKERQGNILLVEDLEELGTTIRNYNTLVESISAEMTSNNAKFCEGLEKIVESLVQQT